MHNDSITIVKDSHTIPKTVLYRELLPFVANYKRLFLLDEDVSLMGWNSTKLFMIWDCAFQQKPLIVQPLVAEDTQYFDFVSHRVWRNRPEGENVIASASGLIEQQVPMFDAVFFEWFLRRVLAQTRMYALMFGVDWGKTMFRALHFFTWP